MIVIPVTSKDIIDGFLKSETDSAIVDVESTGRPMISVYNGLRQYIKSHKITNVTVMLHRGNILMINNEKCRKDSAVRPQ